MEENKLISYEMFFKKTLIVETLFHEEKKMISLRFQSKAPAKIKNSSFPLILFSTLSMHTYPQTSHYLAPYPIHTHQDRDFNVPHLHLTVSNLHHTVPYSHFFSTWPSKWTLTHRWLHYTLPSSLSIWTLQTNTHLYKYFTLLNPYPYSILPPPQCTLTQGLHVFLLRDFGLLQQLLLG